MKSFAIAAAISIRAASTSAVAIDRRQTAPANLDLIKTAVFDWKANTGNVSAFLDQAASVIQAGGSIDLTAMAAIALGHANDELNQKTILEGQLCTDTACDSDVNGNVFLQGAKNLLESGTFANVVTQLDFLSGVVGTEVLIAMEAVDSISLGSVALEGRCQAVLL